ncbi:MAG: glycosyltransferase family 39 protein [bacterium]
MNIWLLLAITTLLRLCLASLFPITADESYYWLWSKHLSLSYVDHPPMVAVVNWLFTHGTENLIMLRLGTAIISFLVSLLIYFLAKEVFNEKVAFWSVVLFQILPHFVVIWLTQFVELPLALFWTLSLLILAKIFNFSHPSSPNPQIRTPNLLWLALGLTIGLGSLSKYTMFLFWPCLGLFFILSPENRFWLKRKELYLCLLLSLCFFSPVLIWNNNHAWASFLFHGSKASGDAWGTNFLPFVGDQLVHFTPFLIFTLFAVAKSFFPTNKLMARQALRQAQGNIERSRDARHPSHPELRRGTNQQTNQLPLLLASFSFPILCLFLFLSLKVKVWAHWPEIGYIAAIPLTINYLIEKNKSLNKFITWIAGFTGLVLIILFWVTPAILLHQKDYLANYQLTNSIPKEYKLFAKTNVSSSLLEFYTKRPVYMATGFLKENHLWGEKQYELWGIPNLVKGETVIYYGDDTPFFQEKAKTNFRSITELPVKLYLIEDYITNNYKMFKLEGYKRSASHP